MRARSCAELAEARSALVDGALGDADRERLLRHLVHCSSCRRDVAELRELRALLSGQAPAMSAPRELSSRLVSIARSTPGPAGSPRRRVRRTAAALLTGMAAVVLLAGAGYAAAPSAGAALPDPADSARVEFAAALTSLPLTSRSVGALMANPQALSPAGSATVASPAPPTGRPLSHGAAVKVLRRAVASVDDVPYHGTEVVITQEAARSARATVKVSNRPGQGSQLQIFDALGRPLATGSTPPTNPTRLVDGELVSLLAANYRLIGQRGAPVAGRSATVVAASPVGGPAAGSAVARWWVDDATGLPLWHETYDGSGARSLAVGFTSVRFGVDPFWPHLAPRLTVPTTTAALTVSNAATLTRAGWPSAQKLAGLTLVRLRTDSTTDPAVVHLVYSDGLTTVSVLEQRGKLSDALAGWRWQKSSRAYTRDGPPRFATWQSGDRVLTVVTDGTPELLGAAVARLPHEPVAQPTSMERVRAGWARILSAMVG